MLVWVARMDKHQIVGLVEALAPPRFAASWDNVGLQVGDLAGEARGVLVSVNPSLAAASYAIARRHNLLVTHHPLLFRPQKSLPTDREPGRTIAKLMGHDIALYAAHTNLDATACNRRIADLLGWKLDQVLDPAGREPWFKVAIFVPTSQAEDLARAMWEAGGRVAASDLASLTHPVEGTFRAKAPAGARSQMQTVAGTKLEVVARQRDLDDVLAAARRNHPYESPACDVLKLEGDGDAWGIGLFGDLPEPATIAAIAARVRTALDPRSMRLVGDATREVRRVAICSGSGSELCGVAADRGVELFITGEVRYHTALDARDRGLAILEIGHQASEEPVVDFLVGYLRERLPTTVPIEAFHEAEPFEILSPP
ncbi:MAG: Nif3-like dinuclear metal center hexameric protein [Candidatus Sericytochromatia bacterium]|nr:Nif3-like dinuclear metal center hexameric protein [Candidatus Tanganyikabacteria bacterium]